MTKRHTLSARSTTAQRALFYGALCTGLAGLSACGAINSVVGSPGLDYKSASTVKVKTLDVPPDLTQLARDNRYAVPENKTTVTASTFNQAPASGGAGSGAAAAPADEAVAPNAVGNVKVERDGSTRYLVVSQSPEKLFQLVKEFWQEQGFMIAIEQPQAGILETDWVENRAKIPQDGLRNLLGKVIDSVYSTGERDKFRTRLERRADGSTEIYISHRGVEEVVQGAQKDNTIWTGRANDPALEAQFLSRLMVRLGSTEAKAKTAVAGAPAQQEHAKLVAAAGAAAAHVEVDEGFDRAWRRVGLALDRVGFTVEDRDRIQGVYFVRYIDNDSSVAGKGEPGFFAKLFTFGSDDKAKEGQRYRITVKANAAGNDSQVSVQNNEGKPETSSTADKILKLLTAQLK
jgi:outer membrane protein assembly factor BamC